MSDEQHNGSYYKSWLRNSVHSGDRPLIFYEGFELVPLFLYGYYSRAIEVGSGCLEKISTMWSARQSRFVYFMHGLAIAGLMWTKLQSPLRAVNQGIEVHADNQPTESELKEAVATVVKQLKRYKKMIEDWQTVNAVNYLAWSKILDAQIAEMEGDHGRALGDYEASLDHSNAHAFLFEEALGNYLQAGFFLRTSKYSFKVVDQKQWY